VKTPIYTGILQSDLDATGYRVIGLPAPASANDAATKAYVDAHSGGGGGSGLDENTVTADDIGLVGDGVTDNSTALQTWLDSVGVAKVNATLLVPDGVYIFSGPLQDTGRTNSQIMLPGIASGEQSYTIKIKGYHPIGTPLTAVYGTTVPEGPIFKSTLATGSGTRPSFICGRGPVGAPFDEASGVSFEVENIVFTTVSNPQITCLNFQRLCTVNLVGDVIVMSEGAAQPTTTTSYGVVMPQYNNSVLQRVEDLRIFNFYTGIQVSELVHISNIGCYNCYYAMEWPFTYHANLIERFLDYWCPYGIKVSDVNYFTILQHDIERGGDGHWYSRVYDVVDAGNQAYGDITWWAVKTVSGVLNQYDVSGGANLQLRRTGNPAGTIYVGTDARLVAVSGGVKLEVRNTGTGVWVEATRYTNP
jgi:hypothetical protein